MLVELGALSCESARVERPVAGRSESNVSYAQPNETFNRRDTLGFLQSRKRRVQRRVSVERSAVEVVRAPGQNGDCRSRAGRNRKADSVDEPRFSEEGACWAAGGVEVEDVCAGKG